MLSLSKHARVATMAATLLLGGCELLPDWLGESEAPPLPGERISVLALERSLQPDPRIADLPVRLPKPWVNEDWPAAGGYANNAMQHLELGDQLGTAWRADVGAGGDSERRIFAAPVIADGRVFAIDAVTAVSAWDAGSGRQLWNTNLTPEGEDRGAIGGGIAYDRGRLYAATAYGEVVALDPASGSEVWRQRIGIPMRAGPTVAGNRLFVISYDNQVHALDIETGRVAWTHTGITELAGLVGAANVAVEGNIVVAPYSSGELFALRTDNGAVAWSDSLVRLGRFSPVGSINDITGRPVIDRGRVYAIGHSGRMAAIDLRSGERVWDREIAGTQSPWVAGDFIFVVTLDAEVLALSRADGRIRWVQQLDRFRDPKAKSNKGRIAWYGPVLAGDRLILVSSHGKGVSLSPYTGEVLGRMDLPSGATVPPVVADRTLYILADNATLLALR